jgi:hypothetical protein
MEPPHLGGNKDDESPHCMINIQVEPNTTRKVPKAIRRHIFQKTITSLSQTTTSYICINVIPFRTKHTQNTHKQASVLTYRHTHGPEQHNTFCIFRTKVMDPSSVSMIL